MVKKTSWKGVPAIGFLCLCISLFAFASTAGAVILEINNPGVCVGSLEIYINLVLKDMNNFDGGESYFVLGLFENDLVEMKNQVP